ncbi:hypothetical protein [Candidatus Magnetomonas plexicatena]|uniref:hypothetical protein n=1 Tax=Candidatus Magnetomonas plexicatena TaxID=2552947 RepID=UPI001C74FC7C|nr:hypothetical protein E2O03_003580 [Nitrospirales bacterium LBB_01]
MGGSGEHKKGGVMKFMIYALLSCSLYAYLLVEQKTIIGYFSKGGFYALLPVATAFLFSIVHGGFTGEFWTVIGIEAKKTRR